MAGSGQKVILMVIFGNGVITILKFIAWFFSKSPSLLAEGVHSFADTTNQILLLVGLKHSQFKPSDDFPNGHGEARYLWNLISAVGVFFIGFGVTAYHSLHSLYIGDFSPGEPSYLGIGVLVISLLVEGFVLKQAWSEVKYQKKTKSLIQFFKDSDDPTVLAILLEDGVAVLGLLFALLGLFLGQVFQNAIFDIIASLFIAILLGVMAILLGLMNGKLLIGKSVSKDHIAFIREFINSLSYVSEIKRLETQIIGAGAVRLSMELILAEDKILTISQLEHERDRLAAGEEPMKVLHGFQRRVLRSTGHAINVIERELTKEFPEIRIIDLELD